MTQPSWRRHEAGTLPEEQERSVPTPRPSSAHWAWSRSIDRPLTGSWDVGRHGSGDARPWRSGPSPRVVEPPAPYLRIKKPGTPATTHQGVDSNGNRPRAGHQDAGAGES